MSHFIRYIKLYYTAGEATSEFGKALLKARYATLRRQVPYIYILSLVNFAAYHLATGRAWQASLWPGALLTLMMMGRALFWMGRKQEDLPPEAILRRLRPMPAIAALLSLAFCIWGLIVFESADSSELNFAVILCCLTGLGCAYGLSSFPNVARMPLILLALPLASRLVLTGEPAPMGIGVCLVLVIFIILRLLNVNERGFSELVCTRSAIEAARMRAVDAERSEAKRS